MKRFANILTATSIAALIAGGAFAQSTTDEPASDAMESDANVGSMVHSIDMTNVIRSRDLTEANVYSTTEAGDSWDSGSGYMSMSDEFSDVGEVEDLLIDSSGTIVGLVAEVGGFLDIGDKHVAIAADEMRIGREDDDDFFIVVNLSEEELEQRESVDEGFWN